MIFWYLGNGGRLTVSGEGVAVSGLVFRFPFSPFRLSHLDEPQRIIIFGHLSEDLFAL